MISRKERPLQMIVESFSHWMMYQRISGSFQQSLIYWARGVNPLHSKPPPAAAADSNIALATQISQAVRSYC